MKTFTSRCQNKAQLKKDMREIANLFGVKRIIFKHRLRDNASGTYNAVTNIMFVMCKQKMCDVLRTFFHELGHAKAVKSNKYLRYHYCTQQFSPEKQFDIENKVDKMAKELWNKHVDIKMWGKYKYFYPKSHKKSLSKWLADF